MSLLLLSWHTVMAVALHGSQGTESQSCYGINAVDSRAIVESRWGTAPADAQHGPLSTDSEVLA